MKLDLEVADLGNGVGVIRGAVLTAVDPGPCLMSDERDGVLDRAARNANVHGRMDDLADGAVRARGVLGRIGWKHTGGRYHYVIYDHRAARRRALAEAGPVVDDGEALRVAI